MPDLASVIRQAEKIRERLEAPTVKPRAPDPSRRRDQPIKYEVMMTTAHLRQMERTLESLRGGIMTASQVSAYLQVSEGRVYELARRGEMPAVRIGRQWRFKREHIDKWLDGLTKSTGRRAEEYQPRPPAGDGQEGSPRERDSTRVVDERETQTR